MKKFIILLLTTILFSPIAFAEDYSSVISRVGFFDNKVVQNPDCEIRSMFKAYVKASNAYNIDKLEKFYTKNYVNGDGYNKNVYFNLIEKTWSSYPNIKYTIFIKDIMVNDTTAMVNVDEAAFGFTSGSTEVGGKKGILESYANSVYYLEKTSEGWKIASDNTVFEKTYLKYGDAKYYDIDFEAPAQIASGKDYTATLNVKTPKNVMVIASIGKEKMTYPEKPAEEVFRKLPNDGGLERVFKANSENINEYSVASMGFTKAEVKNGTEIKIYITGLAFAMSRVNVIPKNDFITFEQKNTQKVDEVVKKDDCAKKTK